MRPGIGNQGRTIVCRTQMATAALGAASLFILAAAAKMKRLAAPSAAVAIAVLLTIVLP